MDLKNVKVDNVVSIILTSGASINGVVGVKKTLEVTNRMVTILSVALSSNHIIDISEDDIALIKYCGVNNEDNKFHIICRDLEKYGIEEDLTTREIINFFIYTWSNDTYGDEEKKDICRKLSTLVDADIMKELLDLIVESGDKLKKYHEKCKKQLKEEYDFFVGEFEKDFDSWYDVPLLNEGK